LNAALRLVAWLLAIALVALPVVAVMQGWVGGERWPLTKLRVHGEFERVDAAVLRSAVLPHAQRGFFAVRLQETQDAIERLPWVERAEVRKRWPDVMEVVVVEHRPFARWGQDRLLSEHGRLFPIPADLAQAPLPQLGGPDTQVQEVVRLYNQSRVLFAPLGYRVERLAMDRRGSWSLALDNGTEVVIGRADPLPRLARFARVLPQLLVLGPAPPHRADLRYTNGFALQWEDAQATDAANGGLAPAAGAAADPIHQAALPAAIAMHTPIKPHGPGPATASRVRARNPAHASPQAHS